jgi:hypothetical protein
VGTVNISVVWRTAVGQKSGDGGYYFPGKITPQLQKEYAIPAVYRWRVMRDQTRWPNDLVEKIYIGEAEELTRRMQWVLTPFSAAKGTDTSKRLNEIFSKLAAEGRKIVIDVADVDPFEINGIRFDKRDLGDRFKRRMLEAFLLVEAQTLPNFELLNVSIDPLDRDRDALNQLTPHQVRDAVKRYGLRRKSTP